uniref:Uncharacterized protein n=1 Tax=Cacopsylla melanoneura TaxID=428564 RepID=A0A8D8VM02_9HEMI
MATPKSKKPSPLISINSPKVAVWQQCKKCLIYLNQKDNGLHVCQDLMQMKHPFILENALYAFIETTNGIDNPNINADNLVLMSLSAIQLCKFQIGEPVQLSDVKSKRSVAKLVWPTCAKSLLSAQVTEHVLQHDLKMSSGDPIHISSLVHTPQPLSQVYLHCSTHVDQYESLALMTAVGSQLRSKLIHCDQTVTVVFYGVALSFTVQKLVPCQETTLFGQSPASPISTATDSITEHFQTLSLSSNQKEKVSSPSSNQKETVSNLSSNQKEAVSNLSSNQKEPNQLLFYKVVNGTKFVITNYKTRVNGKENGGAVYRMEDIGGLDQIVEELVSILNVSLGVSPSIQGMKKSNGILIHGVNGTGKTSLIQSLASHMKVTRAEIHIRPGEASHFMSSVSNRSSA